jgi:proteasome lid subunit RPN8/RPN11
VLALLPRHLAAVRRHAGKAYPEECCGLLIGEPTAEGARVLAVVPARNCDPRPRHAYDVDPRALLDGHRLAREAGREVVGYYHSHPDVPARPSRRDHAAALPGASYLIVAVEAGRATEARSFRLGEGGRLREEPLAVERTPAPRPAARPRASGRRAPADLRPAEAEQAAGAAREARRPAAGARR